MTPTRIIYLLCAALCLSSFITPPAALAMGIVVAFAGLSSFGAESKKISRLIMQTCIVMLGLRVNLWQLWEHASRGFAFAAATIVGAFIIGFLLERLLKTGKELTLLVSSGTAICGGSAIAAVGSAIQASASAMAVATGAIFILNAAALFTFPAIGHALHLTDTQFGTWAGVAIHDMSSVAGAGASYHAADASSSVALDTANIVKLSRVIWILPCTLFGAWLMRRERGEAKGKQAAWWSAVPPFILFFIVASAVRTFAPVPAETMGQIEKLTKSIAGAGFSGAIFLIGAGLSPAALRSVGWRVLLQAVVTWVSLAAASLIAVMQWQA